MLGLVGTILLMGDILFVANWLSEKGVVEWAETISAEYLTGTAIAVLTALLILFVSPRTKTGGLARRYPVCDRVLLTKGSYCSECGS